MTSFSPGDRVRQKTEFDPLAAYADLYGMPRQCGTVNAEQPYPDVVLVTFDEDGVEAAGSCAPMAPHELELVADV